MLTSLFGNSKPINFLLATIYVVVFYFFTAFWNEAPGFSVVLEKIGVLLILIFSMILLNFIAKRNELTGRNSYKIILFAAFFFMLNGIPDNAGIIIANLLVLFALRRVISLRSQRHTNKKIFDATLWICIASLFYFWSILFLFLVFFGILVFVSQDYKNWLIPIIGFLTVFMLSTCAILLFQDKFFTFSMWFQNSSFDFSLYHDPVRLVPVAFLIALTLWCSFFYFQVIERTSANLKASHILVFLALIIGYLIAVFSPVKNSGELIFVLAPLAIIVTNYFQILEDKWFREILLVVIIVLPVFLAWFF